MPKFITITFLLTLLLLVVYSYTQVDLNLTLSANSYYQNLQKILTQIGYFNRPFSSLIYLVLLSSLFIHYLFFLKTIRRNLIKKSYLIKLIAFSVVILFFAYPAFSHDIFNYIFDARIIGQYGLNPYEYKALDFPDDTWTRFMRWTHRTYPYGPLWIVLTLPFYFIGFGKFVFTLLSFKLLFTLSFVGVSFFIYKIMTAINKNQALFSLAWFALNPLVLIESLVSPHNEIVMLLFILLSLYLVLQKKFVSGVISMVASGGIKFLSWTYIPVLFLIKKNSTQIEKYIKILIALTAILLIPVVLQREIYPWYLIPIIGLAALLTKSHLLKAMIMGLCLGTLLRYVPYLYTGEYSKYLSMWQNVLTLIPVIFLLAIYLLTYKKNLNL